MRSGDLRATKYSLQRAIRVTSVDETCVRETCVYEKSMKQVLRKRQGPRRGYWLPLKPLSNTSRSGRLQATRECATFPAASSTIEGAD